MTPRDEPAWARRGGPVTRAAQQLPEGALPSWAWIRPLALAVFRDGPRILVEDAEAWDRRDRFYRPPGGGVEFGERGTDALRREMREEFDAEIRDVRLLGTLESIFEYHGRPGHEIVLVFEARFEDASRYEAERIVGTEGGGIRIEAIWLDVSRPLDRPLYPDGLLELLQAQWAEEARR